jgi:hypothetical protein
MEKLYACKHMPAGDEQGSVAKKENNKKKTGGVGRVQEASHGLLCSEKRVLLMQQWPYIQPAKPQG